MATRNPEAIHPRTLPNRKCPHDTQEAEQQDRQAAWEAQLRVWRSLLPLLMEKFARIKDPRRPGSIRHQVTVLLLFALFLFVFQLSSRREANRALTRPTFWVLFREVFPEIDSIPHADTVNRFLERIDPDELELVLIATVKHLMRRGKLVAWLVEKQYVIAVDGSQKLTRNWSWAEETLHRHHGEGTVSYAAYALEACLVGPQGVSIPLMTEFCENRQDGDEFAKQDSEYKACRRLLVRVRQKFPKARMMIVADGLYPNGPFMAWCRSLRLDYMLVLPAHSLPSVWEEVNGLRKLEDGRLRTHTWGHRHQKFWCVNGITYDFQKAEGGKGRLMLHVVGCDERWEENGRSHETQWVWLSSRPLTAKNVVARCNRAARHRWDIETNFLVEKQQGYQYEHAFSLTWQAMKNWHTLMHLGHLLNTLTLLTDTLVKKVQTLGVRGTLQYLRETWMNRWITPAQLRTYCRKRPHRIIA